MGNKCEKYGLAITNYVLGEKINVTLGKLFSHLLACKKCREELFDWQNNIAVLRAEEYHNRPEIKNKTESLIRKLKKELIKSTPEVKPMPGEKILNHEAHVGSAAGVIWHTLGKYGKTSLTDLPQKAKLSPLNAYEAVGWLARENKIYRSYDKQTTYAWLNEQERNIYQQKQVRV